MDGGQRGASICRITALPLLLSHLRTAYSDALFAPTATWGVLYDGWAAAVQEVSSARVRTRLRRQMNAFFVWAILSLSAPLSSEGRQARRDVMAQMAGKCADLLVAARCCLHNWSDVERLQPHLPILFVVCRATDRGDAFCISCLQHFSAVHPPALVTHAWALVCESARFSVSHFECIINPLIYFDKLHTYSQVLVDCVNASQPVHLLSLVTSCDFTSLLSLSFVSAESVVRFINFVHSAAPVACNSVVAAVCSMASVFHKGRLFILLAEKPDVARLVIASMAVEELELFVQSHRLNRQIFSLLLSLFQENEAVHGLLKTLSKKTHIG